MVYASDAGNQLDQRPFQCLAFELRRGALEQNVQRLPHHGDCAAQDQQGDPEAGWGYELNAIAAVVIGGTSLSGGEGTILGTIIGAFVISVLTNGLRILSVPQEWQIVVTGTVLVLVVFIDILRRRQT